MNETSLRLAERMVPSTYLQQAAETRAARERKIRVLIDQVWSVHTDNSRAKMKTKIHTL